MRQFATRGERAAAERQAALPARLRRRQHRGADRISAVVARESTCERLRQARAFGFNTVRFHSMTPPEEFFHAADEVGLLVMAELPAAYTQYVLPHRDIPAAGARPTS